VVFTDGLLRGCKLAKDVLRGLVMLDLILFMGCGTGVNILCGEVFKGNPGGVLR
jgi:hypothetical protein